MVIKHHYEEWGQTVMLKVFLVEDEYVVREGIKNNIDWAGHGYDFVGEAGDGELAFPMIEKLRPDIVITDIRMPFMDGLELSRLLREKMPETEIIILSGFEEFEYAKEAIKLGIAQYLTKPIKGDDLLKEVDIISERLNKRKQEENLRNKYQREMLENTLTDRRALFTYLVSGGKSMQELYSMASKLEMDLSSMWYNLMLVKVKSINHEIEEYSPSSVRASRVIGDLLDDEHLLVFDRNLEGAAVIIKADSEAELNQIEDTVIEKFVDVMNGFGHLRYFGGLGEPVNRLSELPGCFDKASKAFAHRYLSDECRFLKYEELKTSEQLSKSNVNFTDVDPHQVDKNKIIGFLKQADEDETGFFVDEFITGIGSSALDSAIFRQYILMDVYFGVCMFAESLGFDKECVKVPPVGSNGNISKADIREYFISIIREMIQKRDSKATSKYGEIIDEACLYIFKNYAKEDLSLNELALHVNLSPNHLSMIFSQQIGQSFIKFLTDFRMEKAKELLRCSSKRSSEIGLEVGYKDPHYFSYIFKKTQGVTPTQFREGKTDIEDDEQD